MRDVLREHIARLQERQGWQLLEVDEEKNTARLHRDSSSRPDRAPTRRMWRTLWVDDEGNVQWRDASLAIRKRQGRQPTEAEEE